MTLFVITAKTIVYALLLWGISFLMLMLFALLAIVLLQMVSEIRAVWNLITFLNKEDHD